MYSWFWLIYPTYILAYSPSLCLPFPFLQPSPILSFTFLFYVLLPTHCLKASIFHFHGLPSGLLVCTHTLSYMNMHVNIEGQDPHVREYNIFQVYLFSYKFNNLFSLWMNRIPSCLCTMFYYSFICWCISRLTPFPCCCKQSSSKHGCASRVYILK